MRPHAGYPCTSCFHLSPDLLNAHAVLTALAAGYMPLLRPGTRLQSPYVVERTEDKGGYQGYFLNEVQPNRVLQERSVTADGRLCCNHHTC